MTRTCVGVALLASSWLFGLGLYRPESWFYWTAAVGLGTLALWSSKPRMPSRPRCLAALLLVLPAVWLLPLPVKAGPILLAVGLALALAPIPRSWPRGLSQAAVVAGTVLVAQTVAVWAYMGLTARCHDLPGPLVSLLGTIVRLSGIEAAIDGATLSIRAAGNVHRMAATWDLLFDPATLCFLVGGWVVLAMLAYKGATGCLSASDNRLADIKEREGEAPAEPKPANTPTPHAPGSAAASPSQIALTTLRQMALLTGIVLAWLPVRALLLLTLYVGRVSLAGKNWPLTVMEQFISPWPSIVMLFGLAFLAARFVSIPRTIPQTTSPESSPASSPETVPSKPWPYPLALALAALSLALLTVVWTWQPVGSRKQGRVMFVEKHSQWEPSNASYDKQSYGEPASYTYSLIYDYFSHYFEMSRLMESETIDSDRLQDCDVLILKIPTARFSRDEVKAIQRFVKRGGGLLMIGDHTNVFNSTTFLNDVSREFGFTFQTDLLFRVGTPYEQPYRSPLVPHPAVCHIDDLDFAVSCSIDPGTSSGRAAIRSGGLWNLPSEYSYVNFHSASEYRPRMRYGSFVQLWTTGYGEGRVAAFTDSTIFSNFCVFQPGKAELFLGMIEWLNHDGSSTSWWLIAVPLGLLSIAVLGIAVWLVRYEHAAWLGLLAAGLFGLAVSITTVAAAHRNAMPQPQPETPLKQVIVDRQVSHVPLSKGAYGQDDGQGFGMFVQWIPRIGYFTARRDGTEVSTADGLVIICPSGSPSEAYRRRLVEYVESGGRLLILDSPHNGASTANSILWPFGLSPVQSAGPLAGNLALPDGKPWPGAEAEAAWPVSGGEPLLQIDGAPVVVQTKFGQGTVTVVAFATSFNDAAMGGHWLQEPNAAMLEHYKLLFGLLEASFDGTPLNLPKK